MGFCMCLCRHLRAYVWSWCGDSFVMLWLVRIERCLRHVALVARLNVIHWVKSMDAAGVLPRPGMVAVNVLHTVNCSVGYFAAHQDLSVPYYLDDSYNVWAVEPLVRNVNSTVRHCRPKNYTNTNLWCVSFWKLAQTVAFCSCQQLQCFQTSTCPFEAMSCYLCPFRIEDRQKPSKTRVRKTAHIMAGNMQVIFPEHYILPVPKWPTYVSRDDERQWNQVLNDIRNNCLTWSSAIRLFNMQFPKKASSSQKQFSCQDVDWRGDFDESHCPNQWFWNASKWSSMLVVAQHP